MMVDTSILVGEGVLDPSEGGLTAESLASACGSVWVAFRAAAEIQ